MSSRPEHRKPRRNTMTLKSRYGREAVKMLLRPLLRWKPLVDPEPGYSIILGVPWDLRHLLSVNLRFVSRCDLSRCKQIHVVFDRYKNRKTRERLENDFQQYDHMPISLHFYERVHGWITKRLHTSNFYNASNCAIGLAACRTRHAIIHDFDLYPIVPDYFDRVYQKMLISNWKFCGLERTYVDGLTDDDNVLGTWCLGIDVQWMRRRYKPMDLFHGTAIVRGVRRHVDPFSRIQLLTAQRGLVGTIDGASCCHVKNLPSTYLQLLKGQRPNVAWRIQYLWYLESLAKGDESIIDKIDIMDNASSSAMVINGITVDFKNTDPTCANVLEDELTRMEQVLFGQCRPEVRRYVQAFRHFLERHAVSNVMTSNRRRKQMIPMRP